MQTTIENLSALERRLTMAVPMAEIDKQVDERLKRIARTVKMAGFRPGKVPMKLVMQQYGPQVRSEVVGDAVERAFSDAVKGQNLRVAGYPKVEPKPDADAASLEFTATFEVYPEIALGDLTQATIERPVLEVTDAEVERTLEVLRKQRVAFEPAARPAQTGDKVTIDFTGRIDGTEFPGGKGDDFAVVLGEGRMLPDFETGIAGMNAGESRKVPVKFPDDYHGNDVAGKTAEFDIAVKNVEAPRLPEIDAEFAKTLGIPDGDLVKMRAEVRANVEREVKKRLGADLKNRVMQALLDSTKPELPRSLIEMEIQRLVQNARADLESRGMKMENIPIDPQLFEDQAKRRVALGLIVGEAVKKNDLGAKPEQVRALVEEQAQSYEQPTEVVRWFYSQPERLAEFEGVVVEDNVVGWVLKQAKVLDKPVAFEELMGNAA
jgi:trigger factor